MWEKQDSLEQSDNKYLEMCGCVRQMTMTRVSCMWLPGVCCGRQRMNKEEDARWRSFGNNKWTFIRFPCHRRPSPSGLSLVLFFLLIELSIETSSLSVSCRSQAKLLGVRNSSYIPPFTASTADSRMCNQLPDLLRFNSIASHLYLSLGRICVESFSSPPFHISSSSSFAISMMTIVTEEDEENGEYLINSNRNDLKFISSFFLRLIPIIIMDLSH